MTRAKTDNEKEIQIQANQSLKNITWTESGIPTLTQQAPSQLQSRHHATDNTALDPDTYPQDFILDFDYVPTKSNGHRLHCSCKQCVEKPTPDHVKAITSMAIEDGIAPLNKKRY